ncbi:MAG: hypothetical protein IKU07_05170 [Oscillospiraceae bacterium]|nr:hypothetical protein [Oscillospiraceae bacterium]
MKRTLALLCILAVMVGLVAVTTVQAATDNQSYQVGFARVDINPYMEEDNFDSGVMVLPLRGSGDVWNRLSTKGLVDDNGDGKITKEDGLKVTCIAVSDAEGNTVLLMTADLIGGNLIDRARTEICTRVEAALASGELKNVKLPPENIYYAGTHTHEAPDVTVYNSKGKTGTNDAGVELAPINENLGIWIERTVVDIGDAAMLALKDRAAATVTRDQLSAKEAESPQVKGKTMNSVRHYVAEDKGCVAGDNFNNRGNDPKQVTQVNDNMYLLKFDFADDSKLPVILVNWRGHPSMNNTNDEKKSSKNGFSADYPGAFRYNLEYNSTVDVSGRATPQAKQVYRVAFFNGEGGNVNPRGREKTNGVANYQWFEDMADKLKESRGNVYGRILCAMAQECLNTSKNRQSVAYGSISTSQYVFNSVRKATGYSSLSYEAGLAYKAAAAIKTQSHPWVYTSPTTGETFVIGSKFHASNIISSSYWDRRLQQPKGDLVDMELNVFMIGPELAFVTVPGEPFDYYYNEDGSNAWDNLLDDTYGRPFVLGYCNGAKGYVPNSKAYDYNLGSTKWQRGSYESSITPFEKGTGEKMIAVFDAMLDRAENGDNGIYQGACAHCEGTVTWVPYNGKADLTTGHYYLTDDTMAPQMKVAEKATVCFDLNGHTVKGATRAFYTTSGFNSVLNIMDLSPEGNGAALGCGGELGAFSGFGGCAVLIDKSNTLNFYSGQLGMYGKDYCIALRGGVLRNNGTVNMYGGTILGGKVGTPTGVYVNTSNAVKEATGTGLGASVHSSGTFRMYGGEILEGTLLEIHGTSTVKYDTINVYSETCTPIEGIGSCVYTEGKFYVSGNARIADLTVANDKGTLFILDNQTAPFEGSLHLSLPSALGGSLKVGTATADAPLGNGILTLEDGIGIYRSGLELFADVKLLLENGTDTSYFGSLEAALAAYEGGVLRLLADSNESVTLTKPVNLDLNGCDLVGEITLAKDGALFGADSQTDDFTVEDGIGYGRIVNLNNRGGTVSGYNNTYLKVTGEEGISFHKVDLRITSMALRPGTVGLYYRSAFKGDEIVAANVRSFGISMGLENASSALAMTPGTYSAYTTFLPGDTGNQAASTLVNNIMRTGNTTEQNRQNANTVIYGCAYLQTDEGFLFGTPVGQTLRSQMEAVDTVWRSLTDRQRDWVLNIRYRYKDVLEEWKIPNILS